MNNGYPRWKRVVWMVLGGIILFGIGKALIPELLLAGKDGVAIVRVEGPILDSYQTVEELKAFAEDPLVKAIVVRIDSPGGGVAPSQEIYNAVKRVRKEKNKTVIASMGTVAASGGYYIAVATDRILANPGTLTGSIGVIMQLANFQDLLEKIGVKNVVVKSGKFKDIGSPFRPMQDEDRKLLQLVMDDVHRQFIDAVAEGRSLDLAEVEQLADGRVFTGQQAKSILLVDDIGDLHDAIKLAGELGGIDGEPRVMETSKPFSFRNLLENAFLGSVRSFTSTPFSMPLLYLWVA
ncbi:MAG: signal peptide peptidase SppA [Nitrospirota bacterium]|nr:signal peptide peptidase SppA [Nitrospirota bacterium]MDH5296619.1 signal peptide peptidase SppA [Nitrospirota bacterium]MDH5576161.1 signal peptide peptidase SppA [Nitrospirota bacterium]